jgi:hypothetical protein
MPYNDYICAISGRHFRDIVAWRNCESINDCKRCPFVHRTVEEEEREKRYRRILEAPVVKRKESGCFNVAFTVGIILLFGGVITGIVYLVKWIITLF